MKKLLLLVLGLPFPLFAQSPTIVTGTVKDLNGLPYSNATVSAQLVPSTSSPTITVGGVQQVIVGQVQTGTDPSGNFNFSLFCNTAAGGCTVISPGGTQWQFTVSTPGVQPPIGTGPQACTATVTISGASQSLSGSFAACPALSQITGGGAPVTFQTNGVNNGSQTALNLVTSAATNGLTLSQTNTGGGNVQLGLSGMLTVPGGGTGLGTLTAHDLYVGNGTGNPNPVAAGNPGQVLLSNGGAAGSPQRRI